MLYSRLRRYISADLGEKGLRRESDDPDVLVAIHAGVDERINLTSYGYNWDPGGNYWVGANYWRTGGYETYRYEEGTLIIDMIDTETMDMIWRGAATGLLAERRDEAEIERIVAKFVTSVLAEFPPDGE